MENWCGFKQAEAAPPNPFFKAFFQTPEVFTLFLDHAISRWEDVSNLSRTCQFVFRALKKSVVSFVPSMTHTTREILTIA